MSPSLYAQQFDHSLGSPFSPLRTRYAAKFSYDARLRLCRWKIVRGFFLTFFVINRISQAQGRHFRPYSPHFCACTLDARSECLDEVLPDRHFDVAKLIWVLAQHQHVADEFLPELLISLSAWNNRKFSKSIASYSKSY